MAKGCKKCDPHEICEECPEWIFTLADLIMCMMGLFVILWVLKPSVAPASGGASEELNQVIGAIREAFGYVPDRSSDDPIDVALIMKNIANMKLNGPGEKGVTREEAKGAEGTDPEVTNIRPAKQATVGGRLLFSAGDAKLDRQTMIALDQIAQQIRGHRNIIRVKGHTSLDDLPENATPDDKLELSLKRALAVGNYLMSKGVMPNLIRVEGCSTFEPVQQRVYASNSQAINRRAEVEVTATLVDELQDPPKNRPTTVTTPAPTR